VNLYEKKSIIPLSDQSTNAPAWPRVSVSPTLGYMRTDKQPLETSEDTERETQTISSEKLTALGNLYRLTLY